MCALESCEATLYPISRRSNAQRGLVTLFEHGAAMTATTPFRICAVVLVLFAMGHTFGFLRFQPGTAEGAAVKAAMESVRFPFGNASRSYAELYRGFGFFVTAYLLFAALISWELPRILAASPE